MASGRSPDHSGPEFSRVCSLRAESLSHVRLLVTLWAAAHRRSCWEMRHGSSARLVSRGRRAAPSGGLSRVGATPQWGQARGGWLAVLPERWAAPTLPALTAYQTPLQMLLPFLSTLRAHRALSSHRPVPEVLKGPGAGPQRAQGHPGPAGPAVRSARVRAQEPAPPSPARPCKARQPLSSLDTGWPL